jgi:pre-mRNA cleavage complex 2 protein Pcf11
MDWHFRVRQRMAEAESRGQHRSWYLDELVISWAPYLNSL